MDAPIQINFFRLRGTDQPITSYCRSVDQDTQLKPDEVLWKVPTGQSWNYFALLSRGGYDHRLEDYDAFSTRFGVVPRVARHKLLDDGLREEFAKHNLRIHHRKVCFDVFDEDSHCESNVQNIRIDRGVSFHLDSYRSPTATVYGYFVSLKVHRSFEVGLEDSELTEAALGNDVLDFTDRYPRNRCLVKVADAKATLLNTETKEEYDVDLDDIVVPASGPIVRSYLTSQSHKSLYNAEQLAHFRTTLSGKPNRDWLSSQSDFVSTWLVKHSRYGHISFNWPYTNTGLSIDTTPLALSVGGGT